MSNKVKLIGHYGSDQVIAQAAWTSTSRELTEDKLGRVDKLLEMLWKEGHHTPFERGTVHFLVTCDIASHIHLLKHRIGVGINSESSRYKELKEDKVYLPEDWKDIKVSKDIRHHYSDDLIALKDKHWIHVLKYYTDLQDILYHQCLEDLTPILGRKRAKESARYFKTYNSQITCDVIFNMRSFAHFYKLRSKENAQLEIQEISKEMLRLVKEIEKNPFNKTIDLIEHE
mgnify:FL=1